MKRISALLVLTLTLCAAVALTVAPTSKGRSEKSKIKKKARPVAGQYIVTLADWAAGERGENSFAKNLADDIVAQHGGRLKAVYKHALNGFTAELSPEAAEALTLDPRVESVEEDGVVTADTTQTNPPWGLDRIDQRSRPLNASYTFNWTGSGVRAYVIDTGIRTSHTQFGGRASAVYDVSGGNGQDCNGHGTHVAGTVGGSTYGVAKGVMLRGVKVFQCANTTSTSNIIAGVNWVTSNRVLPAVANMSVGGGASSSMDTAVQNLINSGVAVAVAAGNSNGANACNFSPARLAA